MKRVVWSLRVAALAALAGAVTALGADQPTTTTYRWVDAQGVVHYSDTPQPGAEKLKIPPAQTYSAAPALNQASSRPGQGTEANVYQACGVQQPAAEQSYFSPEEIPVSLNLRPALRSEDRLSVTLDGAALQPLEDSPLHFRIAEPDRGTHTLSVSVHDAAGNVICSSPGVTFYVQRPSRLSPQSPTRSN
jgi:hypothetical protein